MQEAIILYQNQVDRFSKRVIKSFYPYLIINLLFLFIPFTNKEGNKLFIGICVTIILWMMLDMFVSCYKWALNQITSFTFYNDQFEITIIKKNTSHVYKIEKKNMQAFLKVDGGRPRVLKLTLFNNGNKIADFYSVGKSKTAAAFEGIEYKIKRIHTS